MAQPIHIFFDIDGTLLNARGAGKSAFLQAFEICFDQPLPSEIVSFAGATDLGVLKQLIEHFRLPPLSDPSLSQFKITYFSLLEAALSQSPPQAIAGAHGFLQKIISQENTLLGLITGNFEVSARLKLATCGLTAPFQANGFGDHHEDRRKIAQFASQGCLNRSKFLIGDTPNDIQAAHFIGAKAIAVTSKHFDRETHLSYGADFVIDDFESADSLWHWIYSTSNDLENSNHHLDPFETS